MLSVVLLDVDGGGHLVAGRACSADHKTIVIDRTEPAVGKTCFHCPRVDTTS
jgi:hypothetical protein